MAPKSQRSPLLSPEIHEMLQSSAQRQEVRAALAEMLPHDLYLLTEGLQWREIAQLVMCLWKEQGIALFEEFDDEEKKDIFQHFPKEWMADVFEEMAPDERADFIKTLPRERTEEILPLVAQAERNDIRKLLQYREGTAGALMTTDYASLPPDISVKDALESLKLQAPNRETIYYIYVVDKDRHLVGIVSLKTLIVAKSTDLVKGIMYTNVLSVQVDEDKELVAKKLADYDFLAIPVVAAENRLVGIVTVDDVIDVVEEETTEDMFKLAAAGEYVDYLRATPVKIAQQRIVWLFVLVLMSFISGWVVQRNALYLEKVVALAFFMPILAGCGGNAGTQASTMIVRGLATGEIEEKNLFAVIRKELSVGLMIGVGLGALTAVRAVLMNRDPRLGIVVAVAMVVTVIVANMLGGVLPLVFKRLKLDPALMSGPFISSILDIVSLTLYFLIAGMIFTI